MIVLGDSEHFSGKNWGEHFLIFPKQASGCKESYFYNMPDKIVLAQKLFLTSMKKCFMSMTDNSSPVSPTAKFIYPTL